jgi:hypothetical protein
MFLFDRFVSKVDLARTECNGNTDERHDTSFEILFTETRIKNELEEKEIERDEKVTGLDGLVALRNFEFLEIL